MAKHPTHYPRKNDRLQKILHEQLLDELHNPSADRAGISNWQALVKRLFEGSATDMRMVTQIASLPKLLGILADNDKSEIEIREPAHDWELFFAFVAKYKPLIDQEIEERRRQNPGWAAEAPVNARDAPWQIALRGKQDESP